MGAALFILIFALAGITGGAVAAFNLGGAADKWVARHNAVRREKAARTMDFALLQPSGMGRWYFTVLGAVILAASLVMLVAAMALLAGV
ncbi:hypothetical protein [Streptomyces sp. NPDC056600]|uniref:hypothetical protein n=1 Tax=Streptomyces sp. NPDC056600 TaxID=3345874 RepID=UPI0036979F81